MERTNSWHNAYKKLVWCTEREGRMIDFWMAFSDVAIIPSSSGGSSEKAGYAIVGRADLPVDHEPIRAASKKV